MQRSQAPPLPYGKPRAEPLPERLARRVVTADLSLLAQLALSAGVFAAVGVIGLLIRDHFHLTPLLLCLVATVLLSLLTRLPIALANATIASMGADYFFVDELGISFDSHFLLRLGVFLGTAALTNFLIGLVRQATRESALARAAAELANREKDEILGILAHDLRAPLTAVQLSLQLIPRTEDRAAVLRHSERAEEACKRVNTLVLDLLDSARAGSGLLSLNRMSHDLAELARRVVEENRVLANEAEIELTTSGLAHPCTFSCDATRISQLLANLLGNALKFTPRKGTIHVSLETDTSAVRLTVCDTGIGMTEEQRRHAFERFWQADRNSRSGVGLGLFIVKAIAEAHGGKISIESAPSQGTKFTISLPRVGRG